MRLFARWIEDALNVTVQRSHDADACEHRRAATRRDQDQGFAPSIIRAVNRVRVQSRISNDNSADAWFILLSVEKTSDYH
jgi:hypothetical protein